MAADVRGVDKLPVTAGRGLIDVLIYNARNWAWVCDRNNLPHASRLRQDKVAVVDLSWRVYAIVMEYLLMITTPSIPTKSSLSRRRKRTGWRCDERYRAPIHLKCQNTGATLFQKTKKGG